MPKKKNSAKSSSSSSSSKQQHGNKKNDDNNHNNKHTKTKKHGGGGQSSSSSLRSLPPIGLMMRLNHRGIDSSEFTPLFESKFTQQRQALKQMLKVAASAGNGIMANGSTKSVQIGVQAQNNHLTDEILPDLAKGIRRYIDLLLLSSNSNSSGNSSNSSSSIIGSGRRMLLQFDFNFSGNDFGGVRGLQELLDVIPYAAATTTNAATTMAVDISVKNLNFGWNHVASELTMKMFGRFICEMNKHNYEDKAEKRRLKRVEKQLKQKRQQLLTHRDDGHESKSDFAHVADDKRNGNSVKTHQKQKNKMKNNTTKNMSTKTNCIKVLNLAKTDMDSNMFAVFCNTSESFGCISTLLLYQNKITDNLLPLQNCLMNRHCTLKELNLAENCIGDVGAYSIACALRANKSLTILNLRETGIQLRGIQHICHALLENCTLESIDLSSNNYIVGYDKSAESVWCKHDEGLMALSHVLSSNKTLKSLSISQQSLTEMHIIEFEQYGHDAQNFGFFFLFESLKRNETLTHLDLRGNERLTSKSLRMLHSVLCRHNWTLREILLSGLSDDVQPVIELIHNELNSKVRDVFDARDRHDIDPLNQVAQSPTVSVKPIKISEKSKLSEQDIVSLISHERAQPFITPVRPRSSSQSSIGILEQLPREILLELCTYLSTIDLLTLEVVSKKLYRLVRRSDFIWKKQLDYYPNLTCELQREMDESTILPPTYREQVKRMRTRVKPAVYKRISKWLYHHQNSDIPEQHQCRTNIAKLNHRSFHSEKISFKVNDLQLVLLRGVLQNSKLPTVLYSDQYGVLAVLEQHTTVSAIRMMNDIQPLGQSTMVFEQPTSEQLITIARDANQQTVQVNVYSHNTDVEKHLYEFVVSQNRWDREWIRFMEKYRFMDNRLMFTR